jgi:hypothetical protein
MKTAAFFCGVCGSIKWMCGSDNASGNSDEMQKSAGHADGLTAFPYPELREERYNKLVAEAWNDSVPGRCQL